MTQILPDCMIEVMLLNLVNSSNFEVSIKEILKKKLSLYYKSSKNIEALTNIELAIVDKINIDKGIDI